MPNDKLSAKEAALLAQARAELAKNPGARAAAAAPPGSQAARRDTAQRDTAQRDTAQRAPGQPLAGADGAPPLARTGPLIQVVTLGGAARAPATDPARRAAALLAAARAETERKRLRRQKLKLWIPAGIAAACGLWALVWMWLKT